MTLVFFSDGTGAVGVQQHGQIINLALKFPAFVSFGNFHPGVHFLKNHMFILNVVMLLDSGLFSDERLVGNDPEMMGTED